MKTIFRSIALLALSVVLALLSTPSWAAPALVQKCPAGGNNNGTGTTVTCVFGSGNTAHNAIIITAITDVNANITIADTPVNTYSTAISNLASGSTLFIFYNCDIAAGANTVTLTSASAASSLSFHIGGAEWSGLTTLNCLDRTAQSGLVTTSNNTSGVTATRSQASELLIGLSFSRGGALTAGTNVAWVDAGNSTQGCCWTDWEYFIASSAGTDAATWTNVSGTGNQSQIATFKAAGATTYLALAFGLAV